MVPRRAAASRPVEKRVRQAFAMGHLVRDCKTFGGVTLHQMNWYDANGMYGEAA